MIFTDKQIENIASEFMKTINPAEYSFYYGEDVFKLSKLCIKYTLSHVLNSVDENSIHTKNQEQ